MEIMEIKNQTALRKYHVFALIELYMNIWIFLQKLNIFTEMNIFTEYFYF